MRKFLLILSLVFLSVHLYAERVDVNTAMKVANTMVKNTDFDVVATRGYSNFYIFSSENSFVIVAADDRVKPVIGYSDSNSFVLNENMTNVNYWLNKVNAEIQYVVDNNIKATEEIENEWKTLLAGNTLTPKNRASVSPLLTTQWDQGAPFNNMCPSVSSTQTVTGCVATAMAQIMNYWEWPKTGTGSHTYTYGGANLSANFGNTTYDWDNMKDTYSSYTTTEANAVATLMYHCGVSVEMSYNTSGNGGSGAYGEDVPYAVSAYFDYVYENAFRKEGYILESNGYYNDGDVTYYYYNYDYSEFSDNTWISMIKSDLDLERPVYYGGTGSGGGHAFVCDGYDANDNFHFNWGWAGYCDGYYPIGSLNPGTGGIGSGTVGEFNDANFIILGLEPNPETYQTDAYTFVGNGSWNTPSNWEGLDGNTLTYMPDFSDQKVIINGTAVIGNGINAEVANLTIKNGKSLTIQDGGTLTVNEMATNSNYDGLVVEEGAQVFVNNEGVAATFKKSVANPDVWETDHNKGWQFISSPLKNADIANFIPSDGDYDLFKYDGTQELQWQNHKDYGSGVLSNVVYTFDTGFDGWTTIDGDSDGYTFFHTDDVYSLTGYYLTNYGFYREGIIFNSMYLEWKSDNYLVAPTKIKVFDGATISFDCYTTIFSGEPEQIGVAISTTGNTSSSDFTSIANYTFSADAKYTVDLSEYAGEDVWIAIHHNTQSPSSGYALFPMIDEIIITNSSHDFEETFEQGRGYLASYETETTANIQGYLSPESSFSFPVTYNANNRWNNFHVLGNPFTFDINWNDFTFSNVIDGIARMTTDGSYKYDVASDIKVGEGFMIMTKGNNPSLSYGNRSYKETYDNINIIATGSEGSDNLMIHFNGQENDGFPKLDNINEDISTVFVQRDNSRYGIASYDNDVTEIPFYFDAKEMGQYRIAIETESKFDNIYLYDRKSGETIDMLAEGEYSFLSEADENPERFVLKLSNTTDELTSDNFVYQSGEDLYVNAEGTIQIIDMMGRVVYSSDVEGGNNVISISNLNKATYIVRNINENQVRIQKIVIL